jgi:hypothetical protein
MAEATNTLAGLVQMNDQNLADIDVTDLLQDAPVLAVLNAVAASNGTLHKYLKQTVKAGAEFRDVNTGVANAASQDELVTATLKYLDGSFHRDVAIAQGFTAGVQAYMSKEVIRAMRSMFQGLELQILGGTGVDADGYSGLPNYSFVDGLDDSMVVNTASGAGGRSCWLIRSTEDDCSVVAGNDGNVSVEVPMSGDMPAVQKIMTNVSTGAGYNAYNAAMGGWFAMQFGSKYSVGRIVNLDSTTSNTLTDDLISEAISKFPAQRQPTMIVLDRVLLQELQDSRTATTTTGAPAPFPESSFNVPIIVTDQLATGESAITTTTTTTTTT